MKSAGFTLLELLFTIAIAAILLSVAIPSFRSTVKNNQLIACSNKLVTAIQFAKSEAITQRQTVHVANDAAAASQPAFRVGVDGSGNNAIEDAELMQGFSCSGDGLTINPDPTVAYVSFSQIGFRDDGQGVVAFTTCNDLKKGKVLTLTTGGGLSTADAASGDCP